MNIIYHTFIFMKHHLIIAFTFFVLTNTYSQQIPSYNANDLIKRVNSSDTLYIINFWATWCVPCVQELPEFNKLEKRYTGNPVKVLLVSLDFKQDYPYKLANFIERKRITPEVVWLNETDPNDFIPKIESAWQGSIPATLIIDHAKKFKKFIEGTITAKEISNIADGIISN